MSDKKIEVTIQKDDRYSRSQYVHSHAQTMEAQLAFSMIERWGMVAGEYGGEDSAGRAVLRLATPEELVKRAFVVADLAMREAGARGLLIATPTDSDED